MRKTMILGALGLALLWGCDDGDEPDGDVTDGDVDGDVDGDADGDGPGEPCESSADCDDGLFCNGVEVCDPALEGADERGCAPGADPCAEAEVCVETESRCTEEGCAVPDGDGDGHGRPDCGGDDCDDEDPNRFPGNAEVCDADDHDEDCDSSTFGFRDQDGDGYVDEDCCNLAADGVPSCGDDCNDTRAVTHPSNTEACDGFDNDCNGEIDEGVLLTFWFDNDSDGYGDGDLSTTGCSAPAGYVASSTDCDDEDGEIHPGATEVCDLVDNNCDGETDPGCDCSDGDTVPCGSDVGECAQGTQLCVGGRYGTCGGGVNPIPEICNGLDDDCDGVNDNAVLITYYQDSDHDGYGNPSITQTGCSPPEGYVVNDLDCDDSRGGVHPGATELCDGRDTDCSEGGGARSVEDDDGDGHATTDSAICTGGTPGMPQDDCNDDNNLVHVGQAGWFSASACPPHSTWCAATSCCGNDLAIWSCPNPSICISAPEFDYNCDGVDTPRPSFTVDQCALYIDACAGQGPSYSGSPPACGEDVAWRTCSYNTTTHSCQLNAVISRSMPCH